MNQFRIRVNEDGSILIPDDFRKIMHLESDDEVIIRVNNGVAELYSLVNAVKRAQQIVKKYNKGKRVLSEQLIGMRGKEKN